MDPSIRASLASKRALIASEYVNAGMIGEGAFGVVIKAWKRAEQNTKDTNDRVTDDNDNASGGGAAAAMGDDANQSASVSASSPSSSLAASSSDNIPADATCVAVKRMLNHREGGGIPQDAIREIKILNELHHANLIRLQTVFTRPSRLEIDLVYEYAPYDLSDLIKYHRTQAAASRGKQTVKPDARWVKSCMHGLLSGLSYLHHQWVMHRDIKPSNILITQSKPLDNGNYDPKDEGGRIKIADFGLSRIYHSPMRRLYDDGEVVTIWYRAPELLLGAKHYTRGIDIWAAGCIFYGQQGELSGNIARAQRQAHHSDASCDNALDDG